MKHESHGLRLYLLRLVDHLVHHVSHPAAPPHEVTLLVLASAEP